MPSDSFLPGVDLIAREITSSALPEFTEIGSARPDGGRIISDQTELVIAVQSRLGEFSRRDDRPAGEQIQLGMKSPDAPHLRTGIKQNPQGGNVADTLGKVIEIEMSDDLNSSWAKGKKALKSANFDEWADDTKLAGVHVLGFG